MRCAHYKRKMLKTRHFAGFLCIFLRFFEKIPRILREYGGNGAFLKKMISVAPGW